MLYLLTFLFGDPRAILAARVLAAMTRMCPCAPANDGCGTIHARAALAIATVAIDDRDPEDAAALLLGVGAHETGFRTERQHGGGPAVSVFQLERPRSERAALLADPVAAARLALRIARSSRDLSAYAGRPGDAAAELRRYVQRARWRLAAAR